MRLQTSCFSLFLIFFEYPILGGAIALFGHPGHLLKRIYYSMIAYLQVLQASDYFILSISSGLKCGSSSTLVDNLIWNILLQHNRPQQVPQEVYDHFLLVIDLIYFTKIKKKFRYFRTFIAINI